MPDNYLAIIKQIVDLIGHLAWPVTTIILLLLIRRPIGVVMTALSDRIMDPRSSLSASYGDAKIGIVGGGLTDAGKKLSAKNASDKSFGVALTEWLVKESPGLTITSFLDGAEHEELRNKAVQHFRLSS